MGYSQTESIPIRRVKLSKTQGGGGGGGVAGASPGFDKKGRIFFQMCRFLACR